MKTNIDVVHGCNKKKEEKEEEEEGGWL
jgi:hypothetical protein